MSLSVFAMSRRYLQCPRSKQMISTFRESRSPRNSRWYTFNCDQNKWQDEEMYRKGKDNNKKEKKKERQEKGKEKP